MKDNGETTSKAKKLTLEDKVDSLLEGQADLATQFELFKEEVFEVLQNINLNAKDWEEEEYN